MPARHADLIKAKEGLLQAASMFKDYNFRSYFVEKINHEFNTLAASPDDANVGKYLDKSREDLEMLKRQALINSMYATDTAKVVEE